MIDASSDSPESGSGSLCFASTRLNSIPCLFRWCLWKIEHLFRVRRIRHLAAATSDSGLRRHEGRVERINIGLEVGKDVPQPDVNVHLAISIHAAR